MVSAAAHVTAAERPETTNDSSRTLPERVHTDIRVVDSRFDNLHVSQFIKIVCNTVNKYNYGKYLPKIYSQNFMLKRALFEKRELTNPSFSMVRPHDKA